MPDQHALCDPGNGTLEFAGASWPILQTPQNRTFPTAVHDSHHRVDGTLAHFFFRDRHFLSNTDKYGSTLTPVSITSHTEGHGGFYEQQTSRTALRTSAKRKTGCTLRRVHPSGVQEPQRIRTAGPGGVLKHSFGTTSTHFPIRTL